MGFQTVVNQQQAPAVAGDFASANPRAAVLSPVDASFIAGTGGATVGLFGWSDANGNVTNAGSGAPTGFIHRDQQALITAWLGEESNVIPQGNTVTLFNQGDFWAKTGTTATIGQKVFASNTTGAIETGAAGATVAGYTETAFHVDSAGAVGELIKISTWG
jgi:hypothetical protein